MVITVADVRNSVNSRLKKSQNNRAVDPARFNDLLLIAFVREIRHILGVETYVPGSNAPLLGLENSQRSLELMKPLLSVGLYPDSHFVAPGGILDTSSMMIVSNLSSVVIKQAGPKIYPIDMLLPMEISDRRNHPNKSPEERFPIAYYTSENTIKIEPATERVNVIYYRVPKRPFYDYDIVADAEVYLDEDSTHSGAVLPGGTASRTQQIELDFKSIESIENRIVEFAAARSQDAINVELAQIRKQMKQ